MSRSELCKVSLRRRDEGRLAALLAAVLTVLMDILTDSHRVRRLPICADRRRATQRVLSPLAPECDGSECCDAANLCSIVFSRNQKRIRKSLVCLIRSLRTVAFLSIAAASVLSRRSVSI
jgi:hypothetical protein